MRVKMKISVVTECNHKVILANNRGFFLLFFFYLLSFYFILYSLFYSLFLFFILILYSFFSFFLKKNVFEVIFFSHFHLVSWHVIAEANFWFIKIQKTFFLSLQREISRLFINSTEELRECIFYSFSNVLNYRDNLSNIAHMDLQKIWLKIIIIITIIFIMVHS